MKRTIKIIAIVTFAIGISIGFYSVAKSASARADGRYGGYVTEKFSTVENGKTSRYVSVVLSNGGEWFVATIKVSDNNYYAYQRYDRVICHKEFRFPREVWVISNLPCTLYPDSCG